jgi:negative regulator of sigma E activity
MRLARPLRSLALALAALAAPALALAAPTAAPVPRATVDAAALLRASVAAPRTVSYEGELQTIRFSSNRANATIVRIEHSAPALTRRMYLAPESLYGDYVITRGVSTYQFDTKHSRVTVNRNPTLDDPNAASGDLGRIMRNYRPDVDGTETIAGRPAVSLWLINRYTGERALRLWIDRKTHLVLKREAFHGNGSVAAQTRFEEVRYTGAIPADIFRTEPPSGYQEVAGRDVAAPSSNVDRVIRGAGFTPITPKNLPQGFELTGADARLVNGIKTLQLSYTDGLRTLSLFENAKGAAADFGQLRPKTIRFEGHDAQYVEDGPTTLLTWSEEGLHFALVGDLLRRELIDIAISVAP